MSAPAPYYQDDAVTLYLADSRDWLPSADALITDPPYGVGFAGKVTKWSQGETGYTTDDSSVGLEVVRAALQLVKRGAVFTGIRLLHAYPQPTDIGCVYSPSGAGRGPWGFGCYHPIAYYGKPPARVGMTPASFHSFALAEQSIHPCPKPLAWARWVVERATDPGETILEPFAGSGAILRAAKDCGRRAIGIEIEERYCQEAAQLLAQEVIDVTPATWECEALTV